MSFSCYASSTAKWAKSICVAGLLLHAVPFATIAHAQSGADPMQSLLSNWQTRQEAQATAQNILNSHQSTVAAIGKRLADQNERMNGAKAGLSAAVLKVAEAKKRLADVDQEQKDTKGETLAKSLEAAQKSLNTVISSAETSQSDIKALIAERERIKSTIQELQKAVQAADAAASTADVLVEAVKSAQLAIAENEYVVEDGEAPALSDLESDFLKESIARAEASKKSAQVAKRALELTRKRGDLVDQQLAKTKQTLSDAQELETVAYGKFAEADKALKAHRAKRKSEAEERAAKVASINKDLDSAQAELQAQQEILQAQTITLQNLKAEDAEAKSTEAQLQKTLASAQSDFETANASLRGAQRERATDHAALMAQLNADLSDKLRGLNTTGAPSPSDRYTIPTAVLFAKNSAKIRKSDALDLSAIAAVLKDITANIPADVNWVLRVDGHTPGASDESWFIGQARALAIAQNLMKSADLPAGRVSASGAAIADTAKQGWIEINLDAK